MRKRLEIAALRLLLAVLLVLVGARAGLGAGERTERAGPEPTPTPEAVLMAAITGWQTAEDAAAEKTARQEREAAEMARVLYGTARYHSADARAAVCWCILNRVESSLYPATVEEVCRQESQWMGYSADNPVVQELYDTALSVLTVWEEGGIRPMSADFLFLTWSSNEIELRTTFREGAQTRYWRVS